MGGELIAILLLWVFKDPNLQHQRMVYYFLFLFLLFLFFNIICFILYGLYLGYVIWIWCIRSEEKSSIKSSILFITIQRCLIWSLLSPQLFVDNANKLSCNGYSLLIIGIIKIKYCHVKSWSGNIKNILFWKHIYTWKCSMNILPRWKSSILPFR